KPAGSPSSRTARSGRPAPSTTSPAGRRIGGPLSLRRPSRAPHRRDKGAAVSGAARGPAGGGAGAGAEGGAARPPPPFSPACGVLAGASGCADVLADDALQQDVAQLRQDVNKLTLEAHRGRAEAETLSQIDRRSREQAAENSRQIAAVSSRIESLNAELTRLA